MKLIRILAVCLLLSSCSTPRATYDYDPQINFSQYNTYGIYPDLISGLSELSERRLLAALEEVMEEEGLEPAENPDLYINIYSEEFKEPTRNRLGVGIGGGGGNVGVGLSGGIPLGGAKNYLQVTFDLVDARNDELVWQAVVESPFDLDADPQQRQKRLKKIISEAFEGYPPKKKK